MRGRACWYGLPAEYLAKLQKAGGFCCHRPCCCVFSYHVPRETPNCTQAPTGEAWELGLAERGILELREEKEVCVGELLHLTAGILHLAFTCLLSADLPSHPLACFPNCV